MFSSNKSKPNPSATNQIYLIPILTHHPYSHPFMQIANLWSSIFNSKVVRNIKEENKQYNNIFVLKITDFLVIFYLY